MPDTKLARVWLLAVLWPGLLFADPAAAEYVPSSTDGGRAAIVDVAAQDRGTAIPDRAPAVSFEDTVNRVSEFDLATRHSMAYDSRYSPTVELHLFSLNWTQQWNCKICQGLTTNLRVSALSISEEPTQHPADFRRTYPSFQAPVGRLRNEIGDNGDAIERMSFKQSGDSSLQFGTNYVRVGSTLSKELFGRSAVSRLAVPLDLGLPSHMSLMSRVNQKEQFWSLAYRYDDEHQSLKVETWSQVQYNQLNQANLGVGMAYNLVWYSTSWIW